MIDDLPPELLAQLSCLPEDEPDDFMCAICERKASNRFNWSTRDYERPPICKDCETVSGVRWNGIRCSRTKPTGGSFRDRRNCLRIGALADAISDLAARQQWSAKHGCA